MPESQEYRGSGGDQDSGWTLRSTFLCKTPMMAIRQATCVRWQSMWSSNLNFQAERANGPTAQRGEPGP